MKIIRFSPILLTNTYNFRIQLSTELCLAILCNIITNSGIIRANKVFIQYANKVLNANDELFNSAYGFKI